MKKRLIILGVDHPHYKAIVTAALARQDVELRAIAQETAPYADEIARGYGVKAYRNYAECLEKERPDMVGVAMYNGARGEWVERCMALGLPTIADKPPCVTLDELEWIKIAREKTEVPLCVMLTCRQSAPHMAIREAVTSGAIGEPIGVDAGRYYALNRPSRPAWMFDSGAYGGPALDLLIHDYDLAQWTTGLKWNDLVVREARSGRYDDPDFNDIATLSAIDNARPLELKALWHSPKGHWDKFTVYGTKGFIDLAFGAEAPIRVDADKKKTPLPLKTPKPFAERFFSALLDGDDEFPISFEEVYPVVKNLLSAKRTSK